MTRDGQDLIEPQMRPEAEFLLLNIKRHSPRLVRDYMPGDSDQRFINCRSVQAEYEDERWVLPPRWLVGFVAFMAGLGVPGAIKILLGG